MEKVWNCFEWRMLDGGCLAFFATFEILCSIDFSRKVNLTQIRLEISGVDDR